MQHLALLDILKYFFFPGDSERRLMISPGTQSFLAFHNQSWLSIRRHNFPSLLPSCPHVKHQFYLPLLGVFNIYCSLIINYLLECLWSPEIIIFKILVLCICHQAMIGIIKTVNYFEIVNTYFKP